MQKVVECGYYIILMYKFEIKRINLNRSRPLASSRVAYCFCFLLADVFFLLSSVDLLLFVLDKLTIIFWDDSVVTIFCELKSSGRDDLLKRDTERTQPLGWRNKRQLLVV